MSFRPRGENIHYDDLRDRHEIVVAAKRKLEGERDSLAAELARCRAANVYDGNAHRRVSELEAALRRIMRGVDCSEQSYEYAKEALGSEAETACEHEWEPVKVTGDNGVIYNCKKCGGTKGWNPGAAVETWETKGDANG